MKEIMAQFAYASTETFKIVFHCKDEVSICTGNLFYVIGLQEYTCVSGINLRCFDRA